MFLEVFAKAGGPLMDDTFKGAPGSGSGNYQIPMTPETAAATLRSKGGDKEWMARLSRGDPATVAERDTLSAAKLGMSLADFRTQRSEVDSSLTGRRRSA
jgi:hypothetical protein